jgi:hypothetical protein
MDSSNTWATKGTGDRTWWFDEYKETVRRLFPTLPSNYIDTRSISRVDAIVLGYFLECFPREVAVLEIGTFVGVSAFHFASHPKVVRVISVGPDFTIADEIDGMSGILGSIDLEPLRNLRFVDVAQAMLAESSDEQQKIEFRLGTVRNSQVVNRGGSLADLEDVEIPALEPSDGVSLVAFVHGEHTKEGVQAILETIFDKNPRAVVILNDCRGSWGPFVQAGVVGFIEGTQEKHQFQLFGDLGPSIATSGLGIIYSHLDAAEAKQTLVEFSGLFSERLDLLRLLRREEELLNAVNWYKKEADKYKNQAKRLRKRNSRPTTENSSQPRVIETPAESIPRVPGIRRFIRSTLIRKLVTWRPSGTDGKRAKGTGGPHP